MDHSNIENFIYDMPVITVVSTTAMMNIDCDHCDLPINKIGYSNNSPW